jgi:hypothetical protein
MIASPAHNTTETKPQKGSRAETASMEHTERILSDEIKALATQISFQQLQISREEPEGDEVGAAVGHSDASISCVSCSRVVHVGIPVSKPRVHPPRSLHLDVDPTGWGFL